MGLYKIDKANKLSSISIKDFSARFDNEKPLQEFTEKNLEILFGLEFISTEFRLESFRFDTLAFDVENNSFVIIEYKKIENFSLMDQGMTYLNLALDHKDSLLLEYLEKNEKHLKRTDIDWNLTRVVFIGPEFTVYQKRALTPDLQFELWEVKIYEDNIISYSQVIPVQRSIESKVKKVLSGRAAKEIETYTIEQHYKKASKQTVELLDELRDRIKQIDTEIIEKPVGDYIGFKISWYNFVSVHVYKDKLKVYVRKEKFENDTNNQLTKVPPSYKWGKTPLWWVDVKSDKTIDYLIPIIKESYDFAPDK